MNFELRALFPSYSYIEQERDTRYTKASILMVVLFMFCHIPRFVANAIELIFLAPGEAQTHRVRPLLFWCMGRYI